MSKEISRTVKAEEYAKIIKLSKIDQLIDFKKVAYDLYSDPLLMFFLFNNKTVTKKEVCSFLNKYLSNVTENFNVSIAI